VEAVIAYILARRFTQAVTLGINYLRKYVKDPLNMPTGGKRMLRALK
jgi:hypothetical protein